MKTMTKFKAVWLVLMALVTCLPTVRAASQAPEVLSAEQVLKRDRQDHRRVGCRVVAVGVRQYRCAFRHPRKVCLPG